MRVAGLWVVVVCRGWALVCLMDLRKGKALLGLVEAGTNSKSRGPRGLDQLLKAPRVVLAIVMAGLGPEVPEKRERL